MTQIVIFAPVICQEIKRVPFNKQIIVALIAHERCITTVVSAELRPHRDAVLAKQRRK